MLMKVTAPSASTTAPSRAGGGRRITRAAAAEKP